MFTNVFLIFRFFFFLHYKVEFHPELQGKKD